MKIPVHLAGSFIAIFFVNTIDVAAEVYKWVDENGNVHYSDQPNGSEAERIKIQESVRSPAVDPVLEKSRDKQRKLLDIMKEERMEKNEQKAKLQEQKKRKKKMCLEVKDYKKNMERARAIYQLDDKGNRVYYNAEKRKAQEKKVADLIKKWC